MTLSRRHLLRELGAATLAAAASSATVSAPELAAATSAGATDAKRPITLPDKASFSFVGCHLNAAYTHPLSASTREALDDYLRSRTRDAGRNWPRDNPRDQSVERFAKLINAEPTEVAVVPSTLEGENLLAASLRLGPGAGVVTDAFHYDASLVMYAELSKRGMPLAVLKAEANRIDYAKLEAAITPQTRLVAVSLVASATGFLHDLHEICAIAHRKGALVYADIIQAAGAVPIDVKASGVDFCCAGTYKWLMGEFGLAFLYVRADRLPALERVQVGWRQITGYTSHFLPYDSPGPAAGDYELGTTTADVFEVSTPNWSGLAATAAALRYIDAVGVSRIVRHREPLLAYLQQELPRHGYAPLTPMHSQGPAVVFANEGVGPRLHDVLRRENIFVSLYKNRIRISVSVYNDMEDIDRLVSILVR